jgi:L-fuconolactonase
MKCAVIDAHQHFWEPGRFEYSWMTPEVQGLIRAFLPEHLKPLLVQAGVDRTIVVQAISSLAEARWLLDLASANDFIAGVVAWADLTSPHLGKQLDEFQAHPRFKGIRHQLESEADDTWMLHEDVLAGLRELELRGIPYDLLVRPRHLKYVQAVRERCPRLKLVVDHIAKPPIAEGKIDAWARGIELVSHLPGVWCKLSGMITEAKWDSWTPEDLRPCVTHVVTQFGYDRLMFGSDWPVCTLAGTYQQVVEAIRQVLGPLREAAGRKLWGETAAKFYQLD